MTAARRPVILAVAALWLAAGAATAQSLSGVDKFHQVDERVYRGAQPTADGFPGLARLGIDTVLDLRAPGKRSRREERSARAAGLRYLNIPLDALAAPTPGQIARVLALLTDPSTGTVFVHCQRGTDRTGTVVACYRIAHGGWSNRQALEEAQRYGLSKFARGMRAFILAYRP